MLGLDDGKLLIAVYAEEPTFITPKILVYSRTEDDDIYSSVVVDSLLEPGLGLGLPETYPSMCRLPDNSILLIHNTKYTTAGLNGGRINFKSYRSTDNGDTWTKHSDR